MYKYFLIIPALVLLGACGDSPKTAAAAPVISSLSPAGTTEATPFNAQPDGSSAFSVTGNNFDPKSVVVANDQKLRTAFGNPAWITATMPAALYEKAGSVMVKVVGSGGQESNAVEFKVENKK